MTTFYIFLALVAGAVLPIQVGVNNTLRQGLNSPVLAALISFGVGSACLLCYAIATRAHVPSWQEMARLPAWAWLGGAFGAYYVAMTILVAPKLGAANLITLTVTTQLIMSLIMDHYGWIGFVQHSVNIWRIAGAILLIVGTLLIVRN